MREIVHHYLVAKISSLFYSKTDSHLKTKNIIDSNAYLLQDLLGVHCFVGSDS
jgi:hypothetical protein